MYVDRTYKTDEDGEQILKFFRAHIDEDGGSVEYKLKALRFLDINHFFPSIATANSDLCSMYHSIELRSPFLDFNIVELGFQDTSCMTRVVKENLSKSTLRKALSSMTSEYGLPNNYFENQPTDGTRNFATQAFADIELDFIPEEFFEVISLRNRT